MSPDFDRSEPGFDVLHRVSENVYTYTTRFLFMGSIPLHNRSVVVRIPPREAGADGTLVVINPVELRPEVESALRRLEEETRSTIRYLVSPGDWHYLFIGQHVKAFPAAKAYVPPGRIPSKAPDFPYTLIDVDAAEQNPFPELLPHLVCLSFGGLLDFTDPEGKLPRHELVFFHPDTRAITSGDVLYYIGKDDLHPQAKAMGQRARVVDFHFFKWKMVRDAEAVQRSFERILTWDFDRYLSIHGDPGNMLEHEAKAQVADLLAWSKAPPAVVAP